MKKIVSCLVSLVMMMSMLSVNVFAQEDTVKDTTNVKKIEVSLEKVMNLYSTQNETKTQTLSKDFATSTGQTGTIYSIGQYIDFSKVLPEDSKVVSVTMYCPTSVRVTQSKYTSIQSFEISNNDGDASIPFVRTYKPTSECKTTALRRTRADVKWFVRIKGRILMQHTGMDGFTVFGGSRMIIEYQ